MIFKCEVLLLQALVSRPLAGRHGRSL